MSRFLQWLNLFGVIALAVLCCVQWSINQRLLNKIAQLEQTNHRQSAAVADLNRKLSDDATELVAVRQRLDISESARHTDEAKIGKLEADRDRMSLEAARYKKATEAWIAASNARDAVIQQANASIKELSARYAAAVAKYNELVGRYNQITNGSQIPKTRPK
ncbi:MAG TPA: hypothetical protein VHY37_00440 [Tepidisphaeraceae bacterium]|jgi:chromosome segregation ATPase|nr:hypothetical protein [Tepidisphaeraceae bacterium]